MSPTCRLPSLAEMPFYSSHGWRDFLSLPILPAWYVSPQSIERGSTHGAIIAVGERFPAFILPNEHGEPFDLRSELIEGPLMSKDP